MPVITAHIRQRTSQLLGDVDRLIEDSDRQDTLRTVVTRVGKVAEVIAAEELKIQQNAHLTPEGKRTQLRALATKQEIELKFLRDEVTKINTSYETMQDLLFDTRGQAQLDKVYGRQPEPVEENPVLRFLREQEIRADWKLKPQPERDREYLRAVKAGDREIVRALSSAPGAPLVTSDMKRRADADYAERSFPAAYANYVQIAALREQLQGLSDLTAKWLDSLGAQP